VFVWLDEMIGVELEMIDMIIFKCMYFFLWVFFNWLIFLEMLFDNEELLCGI
jgi:hypothetical protein